MSLKIKLTLIFTLLLFIPNFTFIENIFSKITTLQTNDFNILIIGGMAVLIALLISYLISKALVSPIEKLTAHAIEIKEGNLNAQIPNNLLNEAGEIGTLAAALKEMTTSLSEYRTNLETKVLERTHDLSKFKQAVDYSTDAVIITSTDPHIVYVNSAWEKLTGYSSSEVIDKNPNVLRSGKTPPHIYKNMWEQITQGNTYKTEEIYNKRKDGSEYQAQLEIFPITEDGKNKFYVGIQQDITRRKEVDRMKTEFISLASHQLRTPMSAIKWFSEMLLAGDAGKLNEEQEKFVSNIEQSNERMVSLVNALLNISRIESGRIIIEPFETDLKKLIENVIVEVQPQIDKKNQNISVSVHPDLPKIMLDQKLIRNVYMNLLTNANKYTQDGGTIYINVSRRNDEVISQISDNGMGIPEQEQDRVFTKFFRGTNIVKTDTDGTGLGLYLVQAIINSSGGKIWFESKEGEGTTFWFSIPIKGMKAKKGEVAIDS